MKLKSPSRHRSRKQTAVDLFAGAGGLTEGLKAANYRVVGAVENDRTAYATYKLNHPTVKLWRVDIRSLSGTAMLRALGMKRGEVDLLAACPPCQGFSTIRTRNGKRRPRDEDKDLIFEVLRLVRSLRPKHVMLENVPRLANDRRFKEFLKGLSKLGYEIAWSVFNTVDFGVPQRRKRLVLLASQAVKPTFAMHQRRRRTVRQCIGKLTSPRKSRDPLHNYKVDRTDRVSRLIAKIPKDGGSRSALPTRLQLKCHKRTTGFKDVYGRMSWDSPAPTITGGCINPSKGRFLHPRENRAITLREAALLQSFPKGYRFSLADGRYAAALLIGNALPPEFIKNHVSSLRDS